MENSMATMSREIHKNITPKKVTRKSSGDDDAESIDDDSAIGADLKWKWSFK